MARWLLFALLGLLPCAACGHTEAQPSSPPGQTPQPVSGNILPTPPLDPGHPAPPRSGSASAVQFDSADVYAFSNNGETGDKGGGTFAVLPGGDEDLDSAWAVFKVQLAADDRPVSLDLGSTYATLPGGEDDLELSYWLAAYSFSQARWDWLDPPPASADPARPGAWNALGTVAVPLNTKQLRQRYCNLGGEIYLCILVEPKVRAGAYCGITVNPSTLGVLDKTASGYFKTEPLPIDITGASGNSVTQVITLDLAETDPGEADRIYVYRRPASGMSAMRAPSSAEAWVLLNYVNGGTPQFKDPTDTINPLAEDLVSGLTYEYCAVGAVLDGNQALCCALSNSGTASLGQWHSVQLDSTPCSQLSLAVIGNKPAVSRIYFDGTKNVLAYQQSSSTNGDGPLDWTTLTVVDPGTGDCGANVLADVNGDPAILYQDTVSKDLIYRWCTTANGLAQTDWDPPRELDGPAEDGQYPSLDYNQPCLHPQVAYADVLNGTLVFIQATSINGAGPSDWLQKTIVDAAGGLYPSVTTNTNAFPVISYYATDGSNQLRCVVSTTTDGSAPSHWANKLDLGTLGPTGANTTVFDVNGGLGIAFFDSVSQRAQFVHCAGLGNIFTEWQLPPAFVSGPIVPFQSIGGNACMLGINPALAYSDAGSGEIILAKSKSDNGALSTDWQGSGTGLAGTGHISLAEVNGHPAMAYTDQATGFPMYAVFF